MKLIKTFILITAILILFSCGEQDGGLFYSLELESAIDNGFLPDTITIGEMVRSNDYYFIAAGKFLYRPASDTGAWPEDEDINFNPTGYESYLCYDMILAGETIYAIFYDSNTAVYALFSAETSTVTNTDGLEWSAPIAFSQIDNTETVTGFEINNDAVFVMTSTSSTSYNVYATALTGFDRDSTFENVDEGINGGALRADFDGTNYWLVAGNKIYRLNSDFSTITDITVNDSILSLSDYLHGDGFSGVVCADTDTIAGTEVYISSEEGVMLKYDSDNQWSVIASQYDEDNGLFSSLNNLRHIQFSDPDSDTDIDIILAGSSQGYYEMNAAQDAASHVFFSPSDDQTSTALTTHIQYSSIDLSELVVNSFFVDSNDSDNVKIFALCYNGGLWKNTIPDDKDYRFWDYE